MIRKKLRDNGLTVTMLSLFVLFMLGQSIVGYYDLNEDRYTHQQPPIHYAAYLTSAHLWARIFENWESEFLQMAAYVILTVFLFQRGSAESKDPDTLAEVDEDPRLHQHDSNAPGPVRKGGLALTFYQHSLAIALCLLFILSFVGHAISGATYYNGEQREHGQPQVSVLQYVGTSRFWFESLQNWQSEFFAVGALVALSIWLREKGSPESKPVHRAHVETGK
jgi:hypothetical protein